MADLQVFVSFAGRTSVVPIGRDHVQLRGNLAAEFEQLGVDIAGFARGDNIYTLSYVARAPREFFLSSRERAFELLLLDSAQKVTLSSAAHGDKQNEGIISFHLVGSAKPVVITRKQVELLSFVRTKTGLAKTSLEVLRNAYYRVANKTSLTKKGFDQLVRDLIPADTLSQSDKTLLSSALTRIFFAFDRNGDGVAEGPDLFTALGTLVSSKGLAFAFRLADANGDGFVSPAEFLTFTRAFLTLVLALNDGVAHFSADYVCSLIDATADAVVKRAFQEADANRDGLLTWSEFSSWFKNGGHMIMPWVSLLQARPHAVPEEEGSFGEMINMDEIIYEFVLAPSHGSLTLTRTDVDTLEHVLLSTGLYEKDPGEVLTLFYEQADADMMLSKESFDECMRALCPQVASLRREDRSRISYILNNVFFAFDRTSTRTVRLDEFCTGFALFCAGTKSNKLQLTFALFDPEETGALKTLDFARFLRSVLTVLFALNDAAASRTSFQVYEAIDRTTARATKMMLKNLDISTRQAAEGVTFEDFANFYNTQSGNDLISFVELLDLSKFPFQDLRIVKNKSVPVPRTTTNSKSKSKLDKVMFTFEMLPHPSKLEVTLRASLRVKSILAKTTIYSIQPEDLHEMIESATTIEGSLSKSVYDDFVAEVSIDGGREGSALDIKYMFDSLFYAFDRDGNQDYVKGADLACALSILCAGKKSDKLAFGFAAFDTDRDGCLSSNELVQFLSAFTLALFALVQQEDAEQEPEEIWAIVDQTCMDLASDVVGGLDDPEFITFEDFAQWYGKGGFKVASFLELLDMSKWPSTDDIQDEMDEDEINESEGIDEEEEEEDIEGSTIPGEHTPIYLFALTKGHKLEVEQQDIDFVKKLVLDSGLHYVNSEDIIIALTSRADELSVISERAFSVSLSSLLGKGRDKRYALEALESLYELCDREGFGCDYRDLLGLLFLCGGSKSNKLANSWNALDQDRDGSLTRAELYTMLRSFLAALHCFNFGVNSNSVEDLYHFIDDSSNVLAAKIFLHSRRKKKDLISFDEFAEFYSEGGGYRLAPWLELLNLSKFIGPEFEATKHPNANHVQAQQHPRQINGHTLTNGTVTSDSRVVFSFKLTEDNENLIITQGDVKKLKAILDQSLIGSIDSESLVRMINELVDEEGHLTEQGFGTFVGHHVLRNESGEKDEFVASALYQLFAAFDRENEGWVQPIPFAVGLSLLTFGSKSSKLSLGWALFSRQEEDDDADVGVGPMIKPVLVEFFVTLLTAINCFAGNCLDDDVIRFAASDAAQHVFDDVEGDEISFDGFASWYTSQGFEHLSWIELLSNAKWRIPEQPVLPPKQATSHL